ncbi:hypothetical protein ACFVXW_31080 [Streptomyces sp. NPDC058251]|uniref:hypothetical protein n=1 Tax=Streptomyces sp. NPDC058251 TaxID=3346404 RepID=UPI0036EA090E
MPSSEYGMPSPARLGSGGLMHYSYMAVAGVGALLALAGAGVAAITTGRLPPLGSGSVLRPALWGYGAVLSAVGLALFLFLGPLHGPDIGMAPYALTGTAVALFGSALQIASRRPGRPGRPVPRTPADER